MKIHLKEKFSSFFKLFRGLIYSSVFLIDKSICRFGCLNSTNERLKHVIRAISAANWKNILVNLCNYEKCILVNCILRLCLQTSIINIENICNSYHKASSIAPYCHQTTLKVNLPSPPPVSSLLHSIRISMYPGANVALVFLTILFMPSLYTE